MRISVFIVALGFLLTSCGDQPFYEKEFSFEGREWKQSVRPEFKVKVDDVSKPYNITLFVRTTTDYPYNNLWIYLKTTTPDGTSKREPFEIEISNPDGSWIGSKTGTIVETPIYFKERMLPQKGLYTFELEQAITKSKVEEILDVGLRVDVSGGQQN